MIKLIKKILKILKNRKVNKIIQFIIENNDMINDRLDEILKEVEKRKKTKDVQMSLDYVPSWITGAKTLLEKINRCVEEIETTEKSKLYKHTITTDTGGIVFIIISNDKTPFRDFGDVIQNAVSPIKTSTGQTYIPLSDELMATVEYDAETGDINFVSDSVPDISTDTVELLD